MLYAPILLGRSRLRALVVLVFAHDMQTQVAHGVCKQGCRLISYTANKQLVTIETCYNCPRSHLAWVCGHRNIFTLTHTCESCTRGTRHLWDHTPLRHPHIVCLCSNGHGFERLSRKGYDGSFGLTLANRHHAFGSFFLPTAIQP